MQYTWNLHRYTVCTRGDWKDLSLTTKHVYIVHPNQFACISMLTVCTWATYTTKQHSYKLFKTQLTTALSSGISKLKGRTPTAFHTDMVPTLEYMLLPLSLLRAGQRSLIWEERASKMIHDLEGLQLPTLRKIGNAIHDIYRRSSHVTQITLLQ